MTPTLITPAASPLVDLADLKAHLRVLHDDDDALITALELAAVAYLDGWGGILGRAIKSQVWEVQFYSWGELRLPMPDVTAYVIAATDDDGAEVVPDSSELFVDDLGPYLVASGPSVAKVAVQFTCGLSETRLSVVVLMVKMLVASWYSGREGGNDAPGWMPKAVALLAADLRWRYV
jgi:uncharacterized phiE125 gp8 family phage protein